MNRRFFAKIVIAGFGTAVISPPLDEAGNSVRAQKAITDISKALHGNPYLVEASPKTN